ncbi:MAG: hypothetical protein V3V08_01270 [Nannocystaceae bacterium]
MMLMGRWLVDDGRRGVHSENLLELTTQLGQIRMGHKTSHDNNTLGCNESGYQSRRRQGGINIQMTGQTRHRITRAE